MGHALFMAVTEGASRREIAPSVGDFAPPPPPFAVRQGRIKNERTQNHQMLDFCPGCQNPGISMNLKNYAPAHFL
jgi:hypothetical protein